MRKILIAGMLLFTASLQAQTGSWCLTTQKTQALFSGSAKGMTSFYEALDHAARKGVGNESKSASITVPVVVHVIHDNGIGNISDAQIFSAIEVLNTDYQRLNADTTATRDVVNAPFKHVAAGMDIEFIMARIDPWGNCTNGIVRVNAPQLTYNAGENCKYSSLGGSDAWPKDQYMNIWVVNSIDSEGSSGTIAGYAYYPYGADSNDGYGILMDDSYMGTMGTATGEDGRVLTHEMGHALGLPHIFDEGGGVDGCHTGDCYTEGDRSCDTPPQTAANWSCNQTYNSCNAVPVNDPYGFDVYDQIENYMSYNYCQNMFSGDQVNIMTNNFTDIAFLANLKSPSNLTATGVLQPAVFCTAEFAAYKQITCVEGEIQFYDYSFSNPTQWSWTVSPGTEGVDFTYSGGTSAGSQNPLIKFLTSGLFSVTLQAGDGVTTDSESKTDYVRVLSDLNNVPFLESFEPFNTLDASNFWLVNNPGNNETFEVVSNVARTGVQSAKLANYGQPAGEVDELISSPVDLSGFTSSDHVTLSFRYAYRKRNPADIEWLKVFLSSDCAETWVQRKTLFGDQLAPQTATTAWSPASESDWVTVHMTNVTSSFFVKDFRYKFLFESDGGNNFFLDDINLYSGSPSDELLGLSALIVEEDWKVYPNPVESQFTIEFSSAVNAPVNFVVRDMQGREVKRISIFAQEGKNVIDVDTAQFSSGCYLIQVEGNDQQVKRIIK